MALVKAKVLLNCQRKNISALSSNTLIPAKTCENGSLAAHVITPAKRRGAVKEIPHTMTKIIGGTR